MVGKKKINNEHLSNATKRSRKDVIENIVEYVINAQEWHPNSSDALTIIDKVKLVYPWIKKDVIYGHIMQANKNITRDTYIVGISNITNVVHYTNTRGRQPNGSIVKH